MKVLLDTCTLLWIAEDDPKISAQARRMCADPNNELYLSSVSAWEIAVKYALGQLVLPERPGAFVPRCRERFGIASLPVLEEAALHAAHLPQHHRDPFDRLLISQSIVHGLAILSPDPHFHPYPVRVIW